MRGKRRSCSVPASLAKDLDPRWKLDCSGCVMILDQRAKMQRALVDPAPVLNSQQQSRYSRQIRIPEFGEVSQRRLVAAKVLVVGAGGLGSPVLQYLAAAGVGTIGIIDDDVVEISNLGRQVIHREDAIGVSKVFSAHHMVAALNPHVNVVDYPYRLTANNAEEIIREYDLVVDGADNFPTRYLVDDTCAHLDKPVVWGSILRFDGQMSVFWVGAPKYAQIPTFPAGGRGPRLRDVFPSPPPAGTVASCAEAGVLGALCGQVGSVMAMEAIKVITGMGQVSLGAITIIDALSGTLDHIAFCPSYIEPEFSENTAHYQDTCALLLSEGTGEITAETLAAWMTQGRNLSIVDVREPDEVAKGVIPGAYTLPLTQLQLARSLEDLPSWIQHKTGPLVVNCRSGVRSAKAIEIFRSLGVTQLLNLSGGFLQWSATEKSA